MTLGVVDLFNQLAKNDFGFFQKIGTVADIMTRDVATLTLDDAFQDAAALFEKHGFHHVPIVDPEEGDVVGIVSDRDLLRHRPPRLGSAADPERDHPALVTPLPHIMSRKLVTVPLDASPELALSQMLDHHVDSVLVRDERGHLAGIVTVRDFMRMVLLFHRVCTNTPNLVRLRLVDLDMSHGFPLDFVFSRGARSIRDVMSTDLKTLGPRDQVSRAMEMMKSFEVRHLPIVVDSNKLAGLLTDRQILEFLPFPAPKLLKKGECGFREELFMTQDRTVAHERISSIMEATPKAVRPDALFVDAISTMLERDLSALPVLDNASDALCGIFTTTDVLRVLRVVFQIGSLVPAGATAGTR